MIISNTLVVGGSGFIGRNVITTLLEQGLRCISVGRSKNVILAIPQITLEEFYELTEEDFASLNIDKIVYALGDPNLNGRNDAETAILSKFLRILESCHFDGQFLLISSNAANPDSGFTSVRYRNSLQNDYIRRKKGLESIALQSKLRVTVIRAPAVIGVDMNNDSHVKRILDSPSLAKVMSLSVFRGTIEIITINDLCCEIEKCWAMKLDKVIIEPLAPAYRWSRIARHLVSDYELEIEDINIISRFQQILASLLPLSIRFLFFPHWITKEKNDPTLLTIRHENVISVVTDLKGTNGKLTKYLLVTGSASGLGAEVTRLLLKKKYYVIGVDVVPHKKNSTLLEFNSYSNFRYLEGDLSSDKFLDIVTQEIVNNKINGIFCIAGIGPRQIAHEMSSEINRKIFDVNFHSTVKLVNDLIDAQIQDKFFSYVASSAGIQGIPRFASYGASKAALDNYFFSLICELDNSKLAILGIVPSGMKTNFQKNNDVPESTIDKYILNDPKKIAQYMVSWSEKRNRKSKIRYFGLSSFLFLILRNLPFRVKIYTIKLLAKGSR